MDAIRQAFKQANVAGNAKDLVQFAKGGGRKSKRGGCDCKSGGKSRRRKSRRR